MNTGSHARPAPDGTRRSLLRRVSVGRPGAPRPGRRRAVWRIGAPLMVLLSGALFAVSAADSEGTDLRPGRYTDLASLVDGEAEQYDALQRRVAELNQDVVELTEAVQQRDVNRYQQRIERLRGPAGLEPRSGTGVRITLSDAPEEVFAATQQNPNLLVVHQQDIQAVVNALWRGGAEALTIQGQRVVSTTGIKCEGNAILLQGRPYPQPYVIEAIGDSAALVSSVLADDYVETYREQSELPDVAIGWDLETLVDVEAPAYEGVLDMRYAEPIGEPLA